jgi:ABC-type phosphate/phosphonate transport system substrate-binding protein
MLSRLSLVALATIAAVTVSTLPAQEKEKHPDPVRIGFAQSIFVDVPPILVQLFAPSFNELTKECTGLNARMVVGGDPFEMSRKLRAHELDFAVYQGVEFAWASQKYPDLTPLMVALNRHRYLKAHLVVRKDNTATCFADIKGRDLALPKKSKEHVRLFLERNCFDCGQCDPKAFFSDVVRPMSTETALDQVCAGQVHATVVEAVAFENYQTIKPGCCAKLKVLKTSETFPVGVIAYRKGQVSEATLNRFRDGMVSANKNERTREMMNLYQITSFEPVPDDYAQTCADIVKAYPPPEPAKVSLH